MAYYKLDRSGPPLEAAILSKQRDGSFELAGFVRMGEQRWTVGIQGKGYATAPLSQYKDWGDVLYALNTGRISLSPTLKGDDA